MKVRGALGAIVLLNVAIPFLVAPFRADVYQWSPVLFWIGREMLLLVMPLTSIWILAKRYHITPKSYGFPRQQKIDIGLFGICAIVTATMLIAYWMPSKVAWRFLWQSMTPPEFFYSSILPYGTLRWVVATYLSLEAGVIESVVFIGVPWLLVEKRCQSTIGRAAFCMISAAIFGGSHSANQLPEVIATFILGLSAAWWFLKLGDLRPVAIGHTLVDISALS